MVRAPLRERLITRLASIDLRPRTLVAKVPFVVLVIGALGVGLGLTLWLSTDAAERSYQLGGIREQNRALLQQKEALERDVRNAQSAPALAEAARNLGMIPSNDAAHLVKDPAGNWVVIGSPKPAEGIPPPPLNTTLPDDLPPEQAVPPARSVEVPVRVPRATPGGLPPEAAQRVPDRGSATAAPLAPWPILGLPPTGPIPDPEPSPAGMPPVLPDLPQAALPILPDLPPAPGVDWAPAAPLPTSPPPGVDEPGPPAMAAGEESRG